MNCFKHTKPQFKENIPTTKLTNVEYSFIDKLEKIVVNTTVVTLGQGSGNIADVFASKLDTQDNPIYPTFAINSTNTDLLPLKNVPFSNKLLLSLNDLLNN